MPIKDIFKVNRKTFFSPSNWLGLDNLKTATLGVATVLKSVFRAPKPQRQESFEEAMKRLELTEADVEAKANNFLNYALGFAILAVCTFIASFFYLLSYHTIAGFLLCLAVTTLLASQAFRFHFWYFQMKHRKLGCTFDEWKKGIMNGEPKQ